MKKILILYLLLLFTLNTNAQSIYLDSLQNAFSGTFLYSSSKDFNSYGYGISYTINSSINFGLIYSTAKQKIEEGDDDNFDGNGFGGYFNINFLNELKNDPFGFEIGFIYQNSEFAEEGRSNDRVKTRTFGVGINLSKRSQSYEQKKPSNLIIQGGISFFPISETEFIYDDRSQGIHADPFVSGNVALAILIGSTSSVRFVVEPSVVHNFKHNITAISVSFSAIL